MNFYSTIFIIVLILVRLHNYMISPIKLYSFVYNDRRAVEHHLSSVHTFPPIIISDFKNNCCRYWMILICTLWINIFFYKWFNKCNKVFALVGLWDLKPTKFWACPGPTMKTNNSLMDSVRPNVRHSQIYLKIAWSELAS